MLLKLLVLAPTLVGAYLLSPLSTPAPVEPAPQDAAVDDWTWPAKPENLQVLPASLTGERLSAPMGGFTRALGVDCAYCHVGESGEPLSSYDFASDANPNKDAAREMIRMLGSINDHLETAVSGSDTRVNMWCHTCHRGRPRPMTLQEELSDAYGIGGPTTALERFSKLRDEFYGRGALDFGDEQTLNGLGYAAIEDDVQAAIAIFLKNTELFPESGNVWDSLGESYLKAGDEKKAAANYKKALTLDPSNDNARSVLQELGKR